MWAVNECIEKVKWLLEHPQERELIAKAGQARTLKDHTFAQRAVQLDEIIRKALSD
jgi:spore maturation protein CgeB